MTEHQTAAQKVFATVELLESILDKALLVKGRSHNIAAPPALRLLRFQLVNSFFRDTIITSPQLRSFVFFDPAPNSTPKTTGMTISESYGYNAIYTNSLFQMDPTDRYDAPIWNTIKAAPRFNIHFGSKPTLRVLFSSTSEAYALLGKDLLPYSWQMMHITPPALTTRIEVIYPRTQALEKAESKPMYGLFGRSRRGARVEDI